MNLMSVAGEYGLVWCMMNEQYYADWLLVIIQ
jgi:hypothetical protein